MSDQNPLNKYFRQPAIYVKLPSEGKFYPAGTLDMPTNKELPILPMTALDEVISRTPDALFNGSAVTTIFSSCVPNIKDPWSIPQIDVDLLLTAVRIASYGHEMEISSKCPHCEVENDFVLDLRTIIDRIKTPDYNNKVIIGDLELSFKPLSYFQVNESAKRQFEEQKAMQLSAEGSLTESEKLSVLSLALSNITKLTIDSISDSIERIKTPDGVVEDPIFIKEFFANCDSSVFARIKDHAVALRTSTEMEQLKLNCKDCEKEYTQSFTLDMSNFFV